MSDKASQLKDKLKEVVATQILDAAEAELAEHGLAAASMTGIAQRAGVSVGTLYNYFKDKDVLIVSLFANRRADLLGNLSAAVRVHEGQPFEVVLEKSIDASFEIFEERRNFLRLFLSNEKPKQNDRGAPGTQFIERFRAITDLGIQSGVLDAADADLYPSALAALIRGVMIQRLDDTQRPFRDATPFVMRLFLEGARKRS